MKLFDIKNIILGLGMGLIIASILNLNFYEKSINDEFIKTEAAKRGFIVLNPEEIVNKDSMIEKTLKTEEKTKDSNTEDEYIKIKINKGDDATITSKNLLENGLIQNEYEFLNRIEEMNKAEKIQYGTYILKKGSNYDEIIDKITIK